MDFKSKPIIVASVIIVVIVVAAGFLYWQKEDGSQRQSPAGENSKILQVQEIFSLDEAKETLGGQIIGKAQNPIEGELPATNPFEETSTNPLKDIYKNPFK